MQPIIIAVCGKRRSGKDAIASYLCGRHGFVNMKFAKYLKGMLREAFGFSDEQLEGGEKDQVHPVYGVTPRRLMQYMGTEVMQFGIQTVLPGIGRSFWALRLVQDMNAHITKLASDELQPKVVISDMRFMHEFDVIRAECAERGYKFLAVTVTRNVPLTGGDSDAHASEREWAEIPCDFQIHNEGTLDALYQTVDAVLVKSKCVLKRSGTTL